ncbi:MAG TPA: glycosyl hydrolase family 18 protein [Bacteroidales bacterium]|nr:glycosyl hydrolase family 18 protein [Bacteroidales bacterium]
MLRRHLPASRWSLVALRWSLISLSLFLNFNQLSAQSIHFEQNSYYHAFGEQKTPFYDSLNGFIGLKQNVKTDACQLHRVVFGFHPYWSGSSYLNYQWNLLSDLCYFSYEVDPVSGDPVTIHDWLTDPAIDSAQANGVRVHLCATIFYGHSVFFNNPAARQNLIDNLISLVQERNADGVNMDIEAVPSSVSDSMTVFMQDLSIQLKAAIPGAILSIDLPAVDWSNNFQIDELSDYLDWFFVMGYDYYWNGSSEAGPVSPLYSLTPGYDYSLARTVSAYEKAGLAPEKFILGIPYYGRQWKTASDDIPSPVVSNGIALTYSNVRSNSSIYNPETYRWEPASASSCYVFFLNGYWNQCFIGLDRDLREKYDIANYRNLAGIGIWALGYDNGYPDLWQAISDKFTDCYIPPVYDTIFDSGGQAWNYYPFEDYEMTIDHGYQDPRFLTFTTCSLEAGYDSLWIYSGSDSGMVFIGSYSGNENPGTITSADGSFTLRFRSDGLTQAPGWQAIFHDGTIGIESTVKTRDRLLIYPIPAKDEIIIELPKDERFTGVSINDLSGRTLISAKRLHQPAGSTMKISIRDWPEGTYFVTLAGDRGRSITGMFVKVAE